MLMVALLGAGCHGDGTAHARKAEADIVASPSRLLVRQEYAGTVAEDRWGLGGRVEIRDHAPPGEPGGVVVQAQVGGSVWSLPAVPMSYAQSDRVILQVRAQDVSPQAPLVVDLAFDDPKHRNRFWRRVEIVEPGWQMLSFPLSHFRYDRGNTPRWEDVTAWGLVFQTDGQLEIHSIELWQDGRNPSPYIEVDDLRMFFDDDGAVREARRGPFVVLTDAPALRMGPVLDALEAMYQRTRERFPNLVAPPDPIPLLIFADEAEYRRFWTSFSTQVGGHARPLTEDHGFTWMGIATTWYSGQYGPVRPVYVHEASHALLERALGLAAQRSWLFEGLGNLDQLAISNQDLRDVYREALARSDVKMTVGDLVSGDPIPTSRYWQATMFMEWIVSDPQRTAALASAMEAMRERGSTDLRPLLEEHFGLDMARLSASFWSWAWRTYAGGPGT